MAYGYDLSIVFCSTVPCGRPLLIGACVCAIAEIIDAHSFLFTVVYYGIVVQYDMLSATIFSEGVPRHACTVYMDTLLLRQRLVGGTSKVHC